MLAKERKRKMPASMYKDLPGNTARHPLDELDEYLDGGDDLSEGEDEKFSSPVPEATPAPVQEMPEKKVPTSPEPTKKSRSPPPSTHAEASGIDPDDLEAELEKDLGGLNLEDVDT